MDPTNDDDYEVFVATTATECAEDLAYGRLPIAKTSTTAYFSTLYANVKHTTWEQVLDPGDGTGTIYISWAFADEKTVASRFTNADLYGEAVTWTINYCSSPSYCNTYTRTGTWRFSSNSDVSLARFATTDTGDFSDDDGAWGAGTQSVDGDAGVPNDFWGHANNNDDDTDATNGCRCVSYGDYANCVTKANLINRIYIPVSAVDADDITSKWVKPSLDYDPSGDARTSYRFKLAGNNDRNLVRRLPTPPPPGAPHTVAQHMHCGEAPCSDDNVANRNVRDWHGATENRP